MRILQLNDTFPPEATGGAARIVVETSEALVKAGHTVMVLTTAEHPENFPKIPGVSIQSIKKLPKRWAHYRSVFSGKRAREVLAVIDAWKPDVIHAHSISWQIGYRFLHGAAARGIPCFYTCHSVMPVAHGKVTTKERSLWLKDLLRARWTYNPLRNSAIRKALQKTHLLSVSDALKNYLEARSISGITTLHNGIDLATWKSDVSMKDARAKLSLPEDSCLFLLAGRLGEDKGLSLLFDLWPSLTGAPHLLLAGTLAMEIPEPLKNVVHIFRNQTPAEMRTLLSATDVTLVPSLCFDSFPTIALESMALARPVIAGDRGGAKESVQDSESGWILPLEEKGAWRERLQFCIDERNALPAFGERGRKRMEQYFSREEYCKNLLAHYAREVR